MTVSKDNSPIAATEESIVALDDAEIHVCQDGPRDAPVLLLIHGTAASGRAWEPLVPLLTGSHRVLRIDLPGCGRSTAPADGSYAVPDQARRAAAALDQLGVERTAVVGHSSGGVVATALTEQRPDLVTALALIDTGPDMAAYIAKQVPLRVASLADLTDDQLRQAISDGFRPGYEIPQAFLDQARAMNLHVFAATSQAVGAYLDQRSLPDRLARLGTPLLVLHGEEDLRWNPAATAGYHTVAGATVTILPGLGHSPNLEDPPRTAEHLLAFTTNTR